MKHQSIIDTGNLNYIIMNENINLCEILKDCPKGTKLYSPLAGEVTFSEINIGNVVTYIIVLDKNNNRMYFYIDGKISHDNVECLLLPSKDQRDWNKWQCPKPKFDPKTLRPFDKILARHKSSKRWFNDFYSFTDKDGISAVGGYYDVVIPYNDETKYLVGTSDEAPEYYKYWED